MASLYIWSPPALAAAAGGGAAGGRLGAAGRPRAAAALALLHLVEPILVIRLHLLELLLELLVAVLQLLDLAGQQGDRLLQLVEPVLDMDRVDALGAGCGRQQERDREQRGTELVHGGRQFLCKGGHFQAWPRRLQTKTPVTRTGVF
jgi:signal transduction histidine kinase